MSDYCEACAGTGLQADGETPCPCGWDDLPRQVRDLRRERQALRADLEFVKVRKADATADALRLHSEKMEYFEKFFIAEAQVASLQKELAERTAERDRAKVIISKACNHLPNGAFCSPEASLDFMEHIPDEVLLVTSELVGKVSSAESRADTLARRVEGMMTDAAVDRALSKWFSAMPPIEEIEALGGYQGMALSEMRESMRAAIGAALTGERP